MAKTKRAQVLMEPDEYAQLERIAAARKTSIGQLIREAVKQQYLVSCQRRREIVEQICRMNLPVDDWDVMKREIVERHGEGLP